MNELLLKEAIDGLKILIGNWTRETKRRITVNFDGIEKAVAYHISYLENWSRQISMRDLNKSRFLAEVFVRLSFSEKPPGVMKDSLKPEHLLRSDFHSVLLGHPGAGKTTTIKYLCQHLLHEEPQDEDELSFPIVVLLREIPVGQSLIDYLMDLIQIRMQFTKHNDEEQREYEENNEVEGEGDLDREGHLDQTTTEQKAKKWKKKRRKDQLDVRTEKEGVLAQYLNSARVLLLLDGLDEIRLEHIGRILKDVQRLVNLLTTAKIVLTSRIGVLDQPLDNSETLYICPFNDQQKRTFATRWLGSEESADLFFEAIQKSPYRDVIGRPLVLANLCMVYNTYEELPDPPSLIYQKVVQLLLEDWDRQRDLRRASRYARFGPDRKRQFLGSMAYELTTYYGANTRYEIGELKGAYRKVCSVYGLPMKERERVLAEVESHTGLFVRMGFNKFEFSHKSLQEYLCADHITRLPSLDGHVEKLRELPNECAIATVLSASPNGLFEFLVFKGFTKERGRQEAMDGMPLAFWNPYITRLLIEAVGFTPDKSLGVAFLTLASYAWIRYGQKKHMYVRPEGGTVLNDALEELFLQPAVSESVGLAANMYIIESKQPQIIRIRVKARLAFQLPDGAPNSILIDSKFVQSYL